MIAYLEPRVSRAALAARQVAVFAAVLFAVALAAHRYRLLETPAFLAVLGVVLTVAALALVLLVIGFRRVWNAGDRGASSLVVAFVVLALVLSPFGVAAYRAATTPPLFDVSTDLDDPPAMPATAAMRLPPMNPIASPSPQAAAAQREAYPEVTGRRYSTPLDRVLETVTTLLKAHGWRIIGRAPAEALAGDVLIEMTARTPLLSLPVDIAIRLTDEGNATYVDMRSVWRYGPRDFGDDAQRILAFLAELDQAVAADAGSATEE